MIIIQNETPLLDLDRIVRKTVPTDKFQLQREKEPTMCWVALISKISKMRWLA